MLMTSRDEEKYLKILKCICDDAPCKNKDAYCILKEVFWAMGPSERTLVQIKLCERFKYIWSEEAGRDIGRTVAWQKWASEGYAKAFADVFDQNDWENIDDIQNQVIKKVKDANY